MAGYTRKKLSELFCLARVKCYSLVVLISVLFSFVLSGPASAKSDDIDPQIDKWIEQFQPSSLSKSDMRKELAWFKSAGAPFRGKTIKSVAEDIKTHYWEKETLAKAFFEITGIRVEHNVIGEGAVVEAILELSLIHISAPTRPS